MDQSYSRRCTCTVTIKRLMASKRVKAVGNRKIRRQFSGLLQSYYVNRDTRVPFHHLSLRTRPAQIAADTVNYQKLTRHNTHQQLRPSPSRVSIRAQPLYPDVVYGSHLFVHELMNGVPLCPFNFARHSLSLIKHKLLVEY